MNLEPLQRHVYIALLTATAIIIGIVESLFPSPFAFAPGAKFGFANLIVLMAIFTLKKSDVIILMSLKLLLTALLQASLSFSIAWRVASYPYWPCISSNYWGQGL